MPPECGTVTSQSQPTIEIIKKRLQHCFPFAFNILDTYPNKKIEKKKEEYYSMDTLLFHG